MRWRFWKERDEQESLNNMARKLGLPKVMYICEHCGGSGWRYPPHLFEPCPIMLAISESAGLKLDAERSATIKAGIQMEKITEMMNRLYGEESE